MDNPPGTKKATRTPKSKKKPMKVVYISNPMKVKTSASEFRALVQELTGRDSDLPDPSKYPDSDDLGWHRTVPVDAMKNVVVVDDDDHAVVEVPVADRDDQEQAGKSDVLFEPFDDDFTAQMFGNYSGFLPSSTSSLYEYLQVDVLRGVDNV